MKPVEAPEIKPDVIVAWPEFADYPLWRQFIHDERDRFTKVIVAFTAHPGGDYSEFVEEAMKADDVTFIDVTYLAPGEDWRDAAVNAALVLSDAEWVWFTEQDFIIDWPDYFWERIQFLLNQNDYVGWNEHDDRLHPSCLFVRREQIDRTSRYFGTDPVDHFYRFGKELKAKASGVVLGWNRLDPPIFEHLQGLTQNHWLVDSGIEDGRFKMDRFARYLEECLAVEVPLNPDWAERGRSYLRAQAA